MLMSRITLSSNARVGEFEAFGFNDAYLDHRTVWEFFPRDDRRRAFLFRRVENRGRPAYLVVSEAAPSSPSAAWVIETKTYEPGFAVGQRLAFSLRANPVIRRRTPEGRQRRDDVVMDAKRVYRRDHPGSPVPIQELVQSSGSSWLKDRAGAHGFAVDSTQVGCEGYRQHEMCRRGRTVRFSTVDMEGVLEVVSPDAFVETLAKGIGPSKAFGCGLLLVRRAS
jgi:CRISPR system Cascade subunit CasE